MPSTGQLRAMFSAFDSDASGTLDADEFLAVLQRGGDGLDEDDAKELLEECECLQGFECWS